MRGAYPLGRASNRRPDLLLMCLCAILAIEAVWDHVESSGCFSGSRRPI